MVQSKPWGWGGDAPLKRKAIRETWLPRAKAQPGVEARFVVGTAGEARVQESFLKQVDNYPDEFMLVPMEVPPPPSHALDRCCWSSCAEARRCAAALRPSVALLLTFPDHTTIEQHNTEYLILLVKNDRIMMLRAAGDASACCGRPGRRTCLHNHQSASQPASSGQCIAALHSTPRPPPPRSTAHACHSSQLPLRVPGACRPVESLSTC